MAKTHNNTKTTARLAFATALAESLRSEDGAIWMSKIHEVLAKRIEELILSDDYCQGIISTLNSINSDLRLGKKAAEQLVDRELRS